MRSRLRQEACRGLLRIDIARRIAVLKAAVTLRRAADQAADVLSVEVAVRVGAADLNGILRITDQTADRFACLLSDDGCGKAVADFQPTRRIADQTADILTAFDPHILFGFVCQIAFSRAQIHAAALHLCGAASANRRCQSPGVFPAGDRSAGERDIAQSVAVEGVEHAFVCLQSVNHTAHLLSRCRAAAGKLIAASIMHQRRVINRLVRIRTVQRIPVLIVVRIVLKMQMAALYCRCDLQFLFVSVNPGCLIQILQMAAVGDLRRSALHRRKETVGDDRLGAARVDHIVGADGTKTNGEVTARHQLRIRLMKPLAFCQFIQRQIIDPSFIYDDL